MITVRLQISGGEIKDTAQEYGLVYLESDSILASPIKDFEKTTYAETEGSNIDPNTVDAEFDYKVKFFVKADGNLGNANAVIAKFNKELYEEDADHIKTFKQVAFYNDYKKVKIVGYPSPIEQATDFWRDRLGRQADVVCVEWNIKVNKPSLCDFNL